MKKYSIFTILCLMCCLFFSCSSNDDGEKELDLTGTWYLSSYDQCEDEEITNVTVSKDDTKIKKVLKKRSKQVYDVLSMERHIKPNKFGHYDYENPQYGDWETVATETYIFKENKLYTDYIEYDIISIDSKKIKLGIYVLLSLDNPNLKKYLTETYSKMD